jgi:hypothetical protein
MTGDLQVVPTRTQHSIEILQDLYHASCIASSDYFVDYGPYPVSSGEICTKGLLN